MSLAVRQMLQAGPQDGTELLPHLAHRLFIAPLQAPRHLCTVDLDVYGGSSSKATVDRLMSILGASGSRATFFVTKAVATRSGDLLRRICAAGHEVGVLSTVSPARIAPYSPEFSLDLQAVRSEIEAATGTLVRGHRAHGLDLGPATEWAYDELIAEAFEYDSSHVPRYGDELSGERLPETVHALRRWGGTLLEVPVSTTDLMATRIQVGSTATIRGLPAVITRRLVRGRESRGLGLVLHLRLGDLCWRHGSRRRVAWSGPSRLTFGRIEKLLTSFTFTSVEMALPELTRSASILEV
jgi:peptidoglycan/xylan/chitin deacetylase (PgdA/CDA1 family)